MCGVVGFSHGQVCDEDIELAERLIRESMIRGKHATGITYLIGDKLITVKAPVPADEFLRNNPISEMVDKTNPDFHKLRFIAHTRYSTSDLRYNQPFGDSEFSIAHNGVISQEPRTKWKYKTQTANDSEMIVRSFQSGNHPLIDFHDASMAVVVLHVSGELSGFRNTERPLWYSRLPRGAVFASTKDILLRSGVWDQTIEMTQPNVEVTYNGMVTSYNKIVETFKRDLQIA